MALSGLNLNFLTVQAKEADLVSEEDLSSEEVSEETSQADTSEETSQTETSEETSAAEENSEIASETDSEAESKEGEENPPFNETTEETSEEVSEDSLNNTSAKINQTAVTYDMDSLATSAKHTKEEIAQRYTRLQGTIVSEANFMKTAPSMPPREVTTNCVFAGGQMSDASHRYLTELVNYYRYLIGVPEFSQNSAHSDSLQAAAVVRFYNPTINPAFSGVHSQMPSSFFELGTKDSINVFSQILNAGSYSSMAEVGIRYGLINVGIATDSSTKQNYVSNIQTRQELLSYKVQGMNFGYVSNSLVGLSTGKSGSATDHAYMFPSAGYFPNEAIDPTTTSWSFELNPNEFGSQNSSNLKVTVQNITKGTDAYECTFANKKLIAGGGDAYAFEAPTDYILKKYRDNYQVTITGLKNKSGEAVTIKYTVKFFDVNECYQTSVKEVRLITGSDAIFIDYNVDIDDYKYVAQIIPKNAIAVCENGREFEIVADKNWESDYDGCYLVNTFLKAKNNLPENVDDKNNILSSASIVITKGSYGNTDVYNSDKTEWIYTAEDGDEVCITLQRYTKLNTTVECIYRIEMDGTITKIADQNSANRTLNYNGQGNIVSTDFRITLNESGKYRYFGYHAYEGTDGFYVTKPSEELTITGLPRIKYNLNSQNFADICNIQNSASNPIKYSQNQSITLANPTADYLTFGGWYLNSNFTGSKVTKVNTSGTSDITLYAKWVPVEYNITYVLNGGTNPADAVKTYNVASGTVTLPEPSKSGYSFAGWCKKSDLSDTPIKEFLTDVPVSLTLYAKWVEGAYTVSYNSNYAAAKTIEKNYSYEEKFSILGKDTFTRNGYTLSGWNTKSDGTGTTYTPGQTNVSKLSDVGTVVTLYAQWTPIDYTVTFDSNGGSEISKSLVIHIDQTYQEALGTGNDFPRPTRDTYVFLGWFTAAEGGTQIKLTDVYGKYADTTLYAHWEKMQGISLVFYTLAPESEVKRPSDRTVYNGYEFGTLPVIERTGYEFTGWYLTEAGAKGTKTEQPVKATDIVNCTETMLILYAGWSQNAFTVTFNATANGGTCSTPSKTVYKGRTYGELPTAEKANSVFNGWFTATSGGTQILESSVFNGSENITLYAQFTERNYIITFDTCCDLKAPSSKNLKYGDVYGTLTELTRTGYKFLGWYTQQTGGSKVTADMQFKENADQTLYAHWEANTYTVSFSNDGTIIDTKRVTYGSKYGTLPTPSKTGYEFLGWFITEKATSSAATKVAVSSEDTYDTAGDKILYARWKANTYKVTFDYNGGAGTTESKNVTFDSAYGTLPSAQMTGMLFAGWYTGKDQGEKVDAATIVSTASNHTLYAHYTNNSFVVTFDTGCELSAPPSIMVENGKAYGELPVLERTGYKFLGWFTTKVADDTTASKTAVKATDKYMLFENQTLYARWEANKYTLSFDSNLEVLDYNPASKEVTYGEPYGELPTLEHSDYTFLGWYKSKDANAVKVKDTDTYVTLSDETLYAHWEMSKKASIPTLKILNEESIISDNSASGSYRRITLYDDAKGVFECETPGAQIYYLNEEEVKALNYGWIPSEQKIIELLSENGQLQTDAMILSGLCENSNFKLYAIAKKNGYYDSPLLTVSLSFNVRPKDSGDVADEDMIENGYTDESGRPDPDKIPNEIWVAGVKKETKVYNGKAQTFDAIRVYDYKTLLTENVDYIIKYSNNIKAGTGKITISGKGNYNKTKIVEFRIEQLDLSNASAMEVTYAYNGKVQKGKTTVIYPMADGNVCLKEKTDFEYVYNLYNESALKEPGNYQVTVQGKGNYKGSCTFTEHIIAKEEAKVISKMKFSKIPTMNATGAAIVPNDSELVITDGDYTLQRYRDYTVVCRNNIKPGTATVTIMGKGKYTGVKNLTFKIQGIALNSKNLVVKNISENGYNFTGNAIEIGGVAFSYINADGVENYLNPQTDIDVTYSNNVNASTKATITIKGKGKYTGTVKKTFTINKITAIEQFEYTYDSYQNYTKGGVKPEIKIRANLSSGMKELIPGKDYTVAYANNKVLYKEDGDPKKKPCMTITFKGNYSGKIQKNFYILPGSLSADADMSAKDIVAGSKPGVKTTVTLIDRMTKSKLAAKTDYDLIHAVYTYNEDTTAYQMINKVKTPVIRRKGEAVDLKNDIIAAGTTIKITVKGVGNYEGSEASTIIRCTKKSIASASVTIPVQVYTGKAIEPGKYNADTNPNGIKVKVSGKYLDASDYEIVSYTNNVLTGTASVTIKGVGEYGGVKTVKFKIVPKAINWKALTIDNLVEFFR